MDCLIFHGDPIYDIKGGSHEYDLDIWQSNVDMITYLYHPFEDEMSQYFQCDFESSLSSCDANPFGGANFFYEYFQPHSSSPLKEHQDLSTPE
jgi:hypothetical protein